MRSLALLTVFVLAGGCQTGAGEVPADDPAAGAAVPASADGRTPIIEIASAEALVNDLDSVDAETVVLNFWATWCGPCRMEFPEFIRYDEEMEGEGVAVRFVSLDQPTDLALVRAFLDEHEVEDPSYLYIGQGDVTRELNPFAPGALPITMVLDGEGILKHTHVGLMTYDALAQTVADVRAGRDPAARS